MADNVSKDKNVNIEEAVMSNAYDIAAMFNVLERKGIVSRQEVIDEVKRIKEDMHKMFEVVK